MWDTIKNKNNLQIIGIDDGEYQINSIDQVFNKIIQENFHTLRKSIHIQEA